MKKINMTPVFKRWYNGLKDNKGKIAINARIFRVEQYGHFGDCRRISEKVYEMRIFSGPGYRVYCMKKGEEIVILLAGGDKSTQEKDIKTAIALSKEIK